MIALNVVAASIRMLDVENDRLIRRGRNDRFVDSDSVVVVDLPNVGRVDELQFHRPFFVETHVVITEV
jgi:hypothetical protein